MSHAALMQVWRDWGPWPQERQAAPPPLDHLIEEAQAQVEDARACAAHLQPPSLIGYGLFLDDHWTIGDAIGAQTWRETRWILALSAPDHRPPLFACLLDLALGQRDHFGRQRYPMVADDELWWARRCWDGHDSPIGRLVDRLWKAERSERITGVRSGTWRVERDQDAIDYWTSEALEEEQARARYLLEDR